MVLWSKHHLCRFYTTPGNYRWVIIVVPNHCFQLLESNGFGVLLGVLPPKDHSCIKIPFCGVSIENIICWKCTWQYLNLSRNWNLIVYCGFSRSGSARNHSWGLLPAVHSTHQFNPFTVQVCFSMKEKVLSETWLLLIWSRVTFHHYYINGKRKFAIPEFTGQYQQLPFCQVVWVVLYTVCCCVGWFSS